MQLRISNKIQLGDTLNPALDYSGVPAVDDEANLESIYGKIDKISGFWKLGKADKSLARYVPNLLPVTRQNEVAGSFPRKAFASVSYLGKKNLEFILELVANTYSNYCTMELVLPIQITKNTTKAAQLDADMITVNNCFARWITDIDIRRYPDDTRILPTINKAGVCQFTASHLKYLPKDSAKTIMKQLLYSNKPVYLAEGTDRRPNNDEDAGVLSAPYQQLFEVNKGIQSLTVTFKGTQRQLEWLEISLVDDKSYQHLITYDSYDLELAANMIQSIKFDNTISTYSLTGKLEYNYKNEDEKSILYKMFIAYNCNGCSTEPLTQYKNNEIYEYIAPEEEYRSNTKDDRIYIDMRRSKCYTDELEKLTRDDSGLAVVINLKEAAKKKMRLRITGFSQAEYWYDL